MSNLQSLFTKLAMPLASSMNTLKQIEITTSWLIRETLSGFESEFEIVPASEATTLGIGYDYASIQHYGPNSLAIQNTKHWIVTFQLEMLKH